MTRGPRRGAANAGGGTGKRSAGQVRRRFWIAAALVVACAGVAGSLALRARQRPRQPNVMLVIVDTLRRDHVGVYGCRRPCTPTMDALGGENVLFTNAYANSNWTKPSVASLFTGLYVSQHGVKYVVTGQSGELPVTQRLPEDAVTLAELMSAAGYDTIGIVENVHISAKMGFSQGFRVWDDSPYGATNVTNRFLDRSKEVKEPFFAYIHYFDPHTPYYRTRNFEGEGAVLPGLQEAKSTDYRWTAYTFGVDRGIIGLSAFERRRLEDLYDGEVRNADTGIGRILATLRARGMYDNTWVIVTADHGENFYEAKRLTHPHDCFSNPQMRIPLIMKMPESCGIRERIVADPVELADILPTIASYLGLDVPAGVVGADLTAAILEGSPLGSRAIAAESEAGRMLVAGKHKYVSVPTEVGNFSFVYDESADPLEEHNLADEDAAGAVRLAALFEEVNTEARRRQTVKPSSDVQLSREEVEKMKSVGYLQLGGGGR